MKFNRNILAEICFNRIRNELKVGDWESALELARYFKYMYSKSHRLYSKLHELFSERLFREQIQNWHHAYSHRGTGSTRIRAYDVKDIYNDAAPIPGEVPNSESSAFIKEIRAILQESVGEGGGKLNS